MPSVSASEAGKTLAVQADGTLVWNEVPTELPALASTDVGKVLAVNSGGTLVWDEVPTELPALASTDVGKVLAVNSGGTGSAWTNALTLVATPGAPASLTVNGTITGVQKHSSTSISTWDTAAMETQILAGVSLFYFTGTIDNSTTVDMPDIDGSDIPNGTVITIINSNTTTAINIYVKSGSDRTTIGKFKVAKSEARSFVKYGTRWYPQ